MYRITLVYTIDSIIEFGAVDSLDDAINLVNKMNSNCPSGKWRYSLIQPVDMAIMDSVFLNNSESQYQLTGW